MSFHVGQLVVCIDDSPHPELLVSGFRPVGDLDGLRRGTIYTIRDVNVPWISFRCPGVRLVEIARNNRTTQTDPNDEPPYGTFRFRPVDEKRIEVFRKIAANPKIEVDA
jgi:hypothetical protein